MRSTSQARILGLAAVLFGAASFATAATNEKSVLASFEALLSELDTKSPSLGGLRRATKPYVGAKVRWRMRSWGGEESGSSFVTPPSKQAGRHKLRIRFISLTLGEKADLGTVDDAGQPVVTCLYKSSADGAAFVRTDGKRAPATHTGPVTLEGTVWGATDEGRGGNLWLQDCAIVEDE